MHFESTANMQFHYKKMCTSVPSLFVLCCWCWRFGSRFDLLLLFLDTSDRMSSLPVRAPWQASLWLPINDCRERRPIFSSSPVKTNHLLLDYLNMPNCNSVVAACHFHFPLNTTTAREEVLLLWALRQALWYIMQSTSQDCELNFLHQRGRTERRHTFFDMTQTATFLPWEAAKLSDQKIDFLNIVGTQNRTSPASSPGLEESILIPRYYFSLGRVITGTHI